jgi:hypothetical protein
VARASWIIKLGVGFLVWFFLVGGGAFGGRLVAECAERNRHCLLAYPVGVVLETEKNPFAGKKAIESEKVGALTLPGYRVVCQFKVNNSEAWWT